MNLQYPQDEVTCRTTVGPWVHNSIEQELPAWALLGALPPFSTYVFTEDYVNLMLKRRKQVSLFSGSSQLYPISRWGPVSHGSPFYRTAHYVRNINMRIYRVYVSHHTNQDLKCPRTVKMCSKSYEAVKIRLFMALNYSRIPHTRTSLHILQNFAYSLHQGSATFC